MQGKVKLRPDPPPSEKTKLTLCKVKQVAELLSTKIRNKVLNSEITSSDAEILDQALEKILHIGKD